MTNFESIDWPVWKTDMKSAESIESEPVEICICCRRVKDALGGWKTPVEFDPNPSQAVAATICPRCSSEKFPQFYKEREPLGKRIRNIGKHFLNLIV